MHTRLHDSHSSTTKAIILAACNPVIWSELQVDVDLHAKSCFRLIPLIRPRNENQFSIFPFYSLSLCLFFSRHLLLASQPTFHTESNNVRVQSPPPTPSPPLHHLMCGPRVSCERAALPGGASSGVSRNLQQTAERWRVAPGVEARRGEWRGSRLNATQVSATHRGLFLRVFFLARPRVSSPFVEITSLSLSLSSVQTFPF